MREMNTNTPHTTDTLFWVDLADALETESASDEQSSYRQHRQRDLSDRAAVIV